jgi:hypothetical protein
MPAPSPTTFDGTRFFDPDGVPPEITRRSLALAVRHRPQAGELADWVPNAPQRYAAAAISGDKVRLSFVGHVTWLIQTGGPQHPRRSRLVEAGLARFRLPGRSGTTIPASPSTRCPRSTSCWSRTATTTTSTSRRCQNDGKVSRRA